MIQIGGGHTTLCQEEGKLLQKYRDRNERCIAILFKSIGVRGRFDFPEIRLLASLGTLQGCHLNRQIDLHPPPVGQAAPHPPSPKIY